MDEVHDLLRVVSADTPDYRIWKRRRNKLIHRLKPILLSLSEDELSNLSNRWDEEEKLQDCSPQEIMEKIVILFANFYFFRNIDTIAPDILPFVKCAIKSSEFIVRIVFSTIRCLGDISGDVVIMSKDAFAEIEKVIQVDDQSSWFCLVYFFCQASKYMASHVFVIVLSHWDDISRICLESEGETQKWAFKLARFVLENLSHRKHLNFLIELRDKCIEYLKTRRSIEASLKVLVVLLERFGKVLSLNMSELYGVLIECYRDLSRGEKEGFLSVLCRCDTVGYIDANMLFKEALVDPFPSMETFFRKWKTRIDWKLCVSCIEETLIHGQWNCGKYCKCQLLRTILQEVPEAKVDPCILERLIPSCMHFVDCVIDNEYLLTEAQKDYFERVIMLDEDHDSAHLAAALRLVKRYPARFNGHMKLMERLQELRTQVPVDIRLEIVETLRALDEQEVCNDALLTIAVTDLDKSVRMKALTLLDVNVSLAYNPVLFQLLSDRCFKIRRHALQMVEQVIKLNPLEAPASMYGLVDDAIRNVLTSPDPKHRAKSASLLYIHSSHCSVCDNCAKSHATTIITICLEVLSSFTETVPLEMDSGDAVPMKGSLSPTDYSRRSSSSSWNMSPSSELYESKTESSVASRSEEEPISTESLVKIQSLKPPPIRSVKTKTLQSTLALMCSEHADNKRDRYLILCFGALGRLCEPYLARILKMYTMLLEQRSNTKFLIYLVRSLTELAKKVFNGLNIRLKCPEIMRPLFKLLATTTSNELSVEIMKLFGSAFDVIQGEELESFAYPATYLTEDSYARIIMKTILDHVSELSIRTLKVIAMIVESDSQHVAEFTPRIVSMFVKAFAKFSSTFRPQLFRYLAVICRYLKQEIVPLLPSIEPLITMYLDSEECMRFCVSLSSQYGTEFAIIAHKLSDTIPLKLSFSRSLEYFTWAVTFCTFAVIRQHVPFDLMLLGLEKLDNLTSDQQKVLVDCLTMVVQNVEAKFFVSRVGIFVARFKCDLANLAKSLVLWQDMSVAQAQSLFPSIDFSDAIEFKQDWLHRNRNATFIQHLEPVFPCETLFHETEPCKTYFEKYSFPDESNVKAMIRQLGHEVIEKSPFLTIRSCSEFLNFNPRLIRRLFPLAFLAAWRATTEEDRVHMSKIIQRIIHEHKKVDEIWIVLIQLLDRNSLPFAIDNAQAAQASNSHSLSLFLLHREYINGNKSVLPELMKVCYTMNKIDMLRTYYTSPDCTEETITKVERASYSGILGDWDSALKLFKESNAPLADIFNCLEKLKRYDDIIDLENALSETELQIEYLTVLALYRLKYDKECIERATQAKDANYATKKTLQIREALLEIEKQNNIAVGVGVGIGAAAVLAGVLGIIFGRKKH